ncbi:hypothetical protein DEU52_106110 [Ensifer adhaerens]|nr:hypothetical protein DEU52_106110 [Ensifer adhaerens]
MTAAIHFLRQKSTELCAGATVFFLLGYQLAGAL